MNRKLLWPILLIGLALVIVPFALSLPSKASAGERMLNDFQPIMNPGSVETTAFYYHDVFVPLGKIVPMMGTPTQVKLDGYLRGFSGMQADATKLVPVLSQSLHMTPAQVQALMAVQFPAMSALLRNMPQMQKLFRGLLTTMEQNTVIFLAVPPGLAHYKPLVDTMQANVDNYRQVNSLPSFSLFTWFFVVPGVLLVLLSGWGLFAPAAKKFRFRPHFGGAHPAV